MKTFRKNLLPLAAAIGMLFNLVVPNETLAWGSTGHEAVAWIAWQQMNATARSNALMLLKFVPHLDLSKKSVDGFADWQNALPATASANDRNMFLFMRAATWPDTIKSAGLVDSDTPPAGKSVDKPIGFNDTASHGYWHFIDQGFTSNSTRPAPAPNAVVQINELRTDLASVNVDATQGDGAKLAAYELVWLEHLVGDIHQPLHAAERFVGGKADRGGNSVNISLPNDLEKKFLANRPQGAKGGAPTELHAFWDDLPGVTSDPNLALLPAAAFAKGLKAANASDVNNTDPASWATDSFSKAREDAYHAPVGSDNSKVQMNDSYYTQALSDADTQIALAGARLAKMLNDMWPDKTSQAKPSTKKK